MATTTQNYQVNVGEFNVFNFKVVEKLPPNSPFASLMTTPGSQTTPPLARGNLNGSAIQLLNGNLAHACDFKFIFTLNFDSLGLVNPVEAIQKALKNSKLKATNRMRALLKDAAQAFREVLDALITTFGLDPSGTLALQWNIGKDLIRKVNEAIEYVAEKVEEVMEWVFFAQEIQKLINWIQSLPEKIKNMLLGCLNSFSNSIKQVANTIQSIPSQISSLTQSQISLIAAEFAAAASAVQSSLTTSLSDTSSTMPDSVYAALMSADTSAAKAAIQAQIENDAATANELQQSADALSNATGSGSRP